jgi:peptidoglycan hydrolase FlgJ
MIDALGARTTAVGTTSSGSNNRDDDLKKVSKQLEGVFVQQLFKAMRDTVPQGEGFVSGGAGEDIFTSLMDEHLAAETPTQWEGGLGEALYRQLRSQFAPSTATALPTDSTAL